MKNLKFVRIFKSLQLALGEDEHLYVYRRLNTPKGPRLYVQRTSPVFDNGIAELYRFKGRDKVYVFVIDKGRRQKRPRQLIFDNWPDGKNIFVMLLDDVIMIADRIAGSNLINCRMLQFVKNRPFRRIVQVRGPVQPLPSDEIVWKHSVLSFGKQLHCCFSEFDNGEFEVKMLTEPQARDMRSRVFQKRDKYKWQQIPLEPEYGL